MLDYRRRPVLKVHRVSNRKHKTYTRSIAIYSTTTKKKDSSRVLNHIRACKLQNRDAVLLGLLRPWLCPAMQYRKLWVFQRKRTTINPYSLLLLSDTHTVRTPTPSPSCSVVKAVSRKYTVSMMYMHTVHTQSQCGMQRNHLITES